MPRPSPSRFSLANRAALRRELVSTFRTVRPPDFGRFLTDLLTPSEVVMLARRLRLARALLAGQSYDEIARRERASFSTIQLVHRVIARGLAGYRDALRRFRRARPARVARDPSQLGALLRRLPGSGPLRPWLALLE